MDTKFKQSGMNNKKSPLVNPKKSSQILTRSHFHALQISPYKSDLNQFKLSSINRGQNPISGGNIPQNRQQVNVSGFKSPNRIRFHCRKSPIPPRIINSRYKPMNTDSQPKSPFPLNPSNSYTQSQEPKKKRACSQPGGLCFEYHLKQETENRIKQKILKSIRAKLKNVDLCQALEGDKELNFQLFMGTKDTIEKEGVGDQMREFYEQCLDSKFKLLDDFIIKRDQIQGEIESREKRISELLRCLKGFNKGGRLNVCFNKKSLGLVGLCDNENLNLNNARSIGQRNREYEVGVKREFLGKRRPNLNQFHGINPHKKFTISSNSSNLKKKKFS